MNSIFADTSALYALLDQDDDFHQAARERFSQFTPDTTMLWSSSYVLLETVTLVQTRLGLDAVKKWQSEFQPILQIVWVDSRLHDRALTALIAAGRPAVSLTDWTSFEIMRELGMEDAFAYDRHFASQGFNLLN